MRVTLLTVHGAVRETVKALGETVTPMDTALVKLAEVYAEQIDARGQLERVLDDLGKQLAQMADDPTTYGGAYATQQAMDKLARSLDAHKVLADLGPRLIDCLTHLGATPKARAAIAALARSNGGAPGPNASPAPTGQPAETDDQGDKPVVPVEDRVAAQRRARQAAAAAAAGNPPAW